MTRSATATATATAAVRRPDAVADEALRRFAVGACMAFLLIAPPYAVLWLTAGDVAMGALLLLALLPAVLIRSALQSGAAPHRLSWAIAGALLLLVSFGTWRSGGLGSLHTCWYLLLPLLGTYLFGPRGCLVLSALATASLGLLWATQATIGEPPLQVEDAWIPALNVASVCGFAAAATLLTSSWRRTAEFERERRAETEEGFARAVQNMHDAVLVLDAEGRVEFSNRAGARMLALLPDGAAGARAWLEAAAGLPMPAGLRDGDTLVLRHPIDGSHYDLAACLWSGRWVLTLHDVSHRVAIEDELRRAGEEAQRASRAKSEFLANLSHEIRTPMNGILGMAEIAQRDARDPELLERLGIIRRCGSSMLSLLNDILDLSRIEAGHMELEHAEFDPRLVLDEVHDTMADAASLAGLDFRLEIDPALPGALLGDHGRLRQVLLNLVANAVKFTDHGSVVLAAEVLARGTDQARLRFSVHDTGVGIAEDELPTLFEKFTQGGRGRVRGNRGTGLGLTISRELVNRMGGRIRVDSRVGKGSSFHVEVPFPLSAAELDPGQAGALVGRRVLIVDHAEERARGLARMVRRLGGRYDTAPAWGEALARLRHALDAGDPFWVLLLAHPAPGSSTRRALAALAQDRALATTPALLCCEAAELAEASGMGAAAALPRPVQQDALRKALLALGYPSATAGPAPASDLRTTRRRAAADAPAPPPEDAAPQVSPRVLLVEDNEVNQQLVVALLSRDGYQVDVVADGAAGVEAAASGRYGLVLMDCQMPGMDGYEATGRIRALAGDAASVPIVALTANAMDGDRDRCLAAGMDDYLTKPLDSAELRATLERWSPRVRP